MAKIIKKTKKKNQAQKGKLKIGDNWNAISIIALSQNNPLKAIAEFIENSIDAGATEVRVIRGKEKGEYYLKVIDNGNGIPPDTEGIPNFKYVATHICDSIKKRLKKEGAQGLQGEFGIGLLSFWTLGHRLSLISSGQDGHVYQMNMEKDKPGYSISKKQRLISQKGTELTVSPLLPGIKLINGEKIQNYLASELRDRIRKKGIKVTITDRYARKELLVEPRQFEGRLIHDLPDNQSNHGEIYKELYLNPHSPENKIGIYRAGTRVKASISELERFNRLPWTSGFLQGMIDVSFLHLTPGTRDGIIHDQAYQDFCDVMAETEKKIMELIEEQKNAEEERTSHNILKSIQKALKNAIMSLPKEEYDWFDLHEPRQSKGTGTGIYKKKEEEKGKSSNSGEKNDELNTEQVKKLFEFPGPLFKAMISPRSCIMPVNTSRDLRIIARDRKGTLISSGLQVDWELVNSKGELKHQNGEIAVYSADSEPGLFRIKAVVIEKDIRIECESVITVTDTLIKRENRAEDHSRKGLPGYTYEQAPGKLWRSRYDETNNLIIVNNAHNDFIFASRNHSRKLRYICRLFSKELLLKNFPGIPRNEMLERMIELSLYTEENLK